MHYTWKTRFGVTVACVGGFWVLAQITAQADANDATQPLSAVTSVVSGSSSEGTPPASTGSQKGAAAETDADGGDGTVTQTNNADDTGGDANAQGINVGVQGLQCIGVKVSCDNDNTTGQAAIGGNGYVAQSNTNTGDTGGDAQATSGSGASDADGGDGTVTQTNNADDTGGDANAQGINVGVQGLQCIGVKVSCDNDNTTGQAAKGGNGYVAQNNTNTGQTGGNATATGKSSYPEKGKDKKSDTKGSYDGKGYWSKNRPGTTHADGGNGTVTQTNNANDTGGDANAQGINLGAQGLQCIALFAHCDNDNTTGQAAIGGNGKVAQNNTNTGQTGGNATAKGADVNPVWKPRYGDKGPQRPKWGDGGKCEQRPERGYEMKGGKGSKGTCAPRPVTRPGGWKHASVPA